MRRYKLVVSDFHVGMGQLLENGEVNPLEDFIFDGRFISFLDFYRTDEFAHAEVELVLNGDFLNTLLIYYGQDTPSEMSEADSIEQVNKIFAGHPELFDALAEFARTPNHHLTYVVGNHDPALLWRGVRDLWNERIGVDTFFPGFVHAFDGIWIEHGHQYTMSNHFDPDHLFRQDGKGREILNLPWGCIWVIEYLYEIKKERVYIDRVQPFGRYLFLGLFFDPLFSLRALVRLVFWSIRQRTRAGMWRSREEFLRTFEMLDQASLVPKLDPFARRILQKKGYHTVIFGHNHQAAYRRYGRDKLYINTGTWNDIIHLDVQNLGRQRRMTYAFIEYRGEEKPHAKLKVWKGTRQTEEDVIF